MAKSISTSASSESGRKRQDEGRCETSCSGCPTHSDTGNRRETSRREKAQEKVLGSSSKRRPTHRTELSRQENLRGSIWIAPLFSEKGFFKETICSKCLYYFHRMVSIGKSTSITKLQDVHSFPHFFIQSSILNRQQ